MQISMSGLQSVQAARQSLCFSAQCSAIKVQKSVLVAYSAALYGTLQESF